ncbi:MAG TPA: polysaccharide deacetylase family protein [Mycobacteriales bacterium]|jgi:peptidoglycan/xylan/chitin deacetylase (PgdA/CDA1 family)|nr:polysaccharide deacetylase family protein [Mycobacteriales bacterium]
MNPAEIAATAVGAAVAAQIVPAGTWLPGLRRTVAPALCGPMPPRRVAVTFDDGPHPEGTIAVLDELDRLGWHATFFVVGTQVERYPDVVAETLRRGHGVELHGYDHRYSIARTPWGIADDLKRGRDTVGEATGRAPTWWRPPYGVMSGPSYLAARALGMRPVLWSAWGRDWRSAATPESVVGDLEAGRPAGGTLLLHDSDEMSDPGSWRTTVAALPLLAERLSGQGLTVAAFGTG